jgi:hypothetical protein
LLIEYVSLLHEHEADQRLDVHGPSSTMEIDVEIRLTDHFRQLGGNALCDRSLRVSGKRSREIKAVLPDPIVPQERGLIRYRHQREAPGPQFQVRRSCELFKGGNTFQFVTMNSSGNEQVRTFTTSASVMNRK